MIQLQVLPQCNAPKKYTEKKKKGEETKISPLIHLKSRDTIR